MRISDWSSDVCSSDLIRTTRAIGIRARANGCSGARCCRRDDRAGESAASAPAPRLAPTRPRATLAPMPSPHQCDFTLEPADNERLANLAGPFDAHLRQIELRLRSEEHTSELQSLMRISYAVFCLKQKTNT